MALIKFANNSESLLVGNITDSQTTFTITAAQGSRFPVADFIGAGTYFYCTLVDISGNREIVKVTTHVADSIDFTCERGADPVQNAAVALTYAYSTGDKVQMRTNGLVLSDVIDTLEASVGTNSTTYQIDMDNTGPVLKNVAGALHVRTNGDAGLGVLSALSLVLAGALSGVTTLAMTGALSGVTTIAMAGALSGATTIDASGVITGSALVVAGTVTGVTALTASGVITGASLVLAGAISGVTTMASSGLATLGSISTGAIGCAALTPTGKTLLRDHGTATTPEAVNVVYGTGSPPTASTTPIGSLFIKYAA